MNGFDFAVFPYLHALAGLSPAFDALVRFFAVPVAYLMVLAVAGYGVCTYFFRSDISKKETRRLLFLTGVGVFISRVIVAEPLRIFIARVRPYEMLSLPHQLIEHPFGRSLPSGHTAIAFAVAAAVYAHHRATGIALFVVATLVGLSRVIAGVHWPSDILGGAIVGIAGVWIAKKIMIRFSQK